MKEDELNRIIKVTIYICIVILLIQVFRGIDLKTIDGVKSILSLTTIIPFFWAFYFGFGWKVKGLNKILYKENINGTWFGKYESKMLETGQEFKGDIALVIKQNYIRVKVILITDKFKSFSFSEDLNNEDDKNQLVYIYSQDEFSFNDHSTRKGATDLELVKGSDKSELYGKFWTNHGSVGHLTVNKISDKHIMVFEEAKVKCEEMM